jgi:biopolymer transport protein ExbB
MMHELFRRLAQFGGEGSLYVLFAMSIVTVAIIAERIWTFVRRYANADKLIRQLAAVLGVDLAETSALVHGSQASLCRIVAAGLAAAASGPQAVRDALQTAAAREGQFLKRNLALLQELGRFSVLIGLVGTLLDLLSLTTPTGVEVLAGGASNRSATYLVISTLAPAVAGLLVAIPAWLTASVLNDRIQKLSSEFDEVAQLVAAELAWTTNSPPSASQTVQAA